MYHFFPPKLERSQNNSKKIKKTLFSLYFWPNWIGIGRKTDKNFFRTEYDFYLARATAFSKKFNKKIFKYNVNPVKNNETQQRKGTQDRSMDRFEWKTSTRCL